MSLRHVWEQVQAHNRDRLKVVTSFQVGPGLSIGQSGLKVGAEALAELGDRDAVNIKLQLLLEVVQVFIVLRTWKQTGTWQLGRPLGKQYRASGPRSNQE